MREKYKGGINNSFILKTEAQSQNKKKKVKIIIAKSERSIIVIISKKNYRRSLASDVFQLQERLNE